MSAGASTPASSGGPMNLEDLYNYLKVDETLITSGQPTAEQLRAVAAEGFSAVINLAPAPAALDEAGLVRALGLTYVHIPVAWDHPQAGDFAAFEAALAHRPAGKILIHCQANYRVTAFYALYAQKHLGWSEAQAEEFRAAIWGGTDDYPVWDEFLADRRAQITAPR